MPYLDTDKQQRLEGVLRRWPLLQGLRTREHRDSD